MMEERTPGLEAGKAWLTSILGQIVVLRFLGSVIAAGSGS